LATRLMTQIRDVCGVELGLRSLFESPTIAELAQKVEIARLGGQPSSAPPLAKVSHEQEPELSYAQQRLWFLDQLEPGSSFYNIPAARRLTGGLDRCALGLALTEICSRHEALRTSFAVVDGRPVQVISWPQPFSLPLIDLSRSPVEEREREARELAGQEAQAPFDLTRGPLIRGKLLRLGESEHVLLLTMHHIVSDGWSMRVLFQELNLLYEAYTRNEPSPLAELPIQYADYAAWQREWLQGEALDELIAYWKRQLVGAPAVLELPTDHPRPAVQSYRGRVAM